MTIPYQSGRDSTVAQLLDTNIDISTLANGDTLAYNSTTGEWENSGSTGLDGLETTQATFAVTDFSNTSILISSDALGPGPLGIIESSTNTFPGSEYYYLRFKPQSTNSNTQGVVFRHDINAVETRVGINTLDPAGALDVAVGDIMLRTGGIALGATPNYGTPGQVLTTNGHGSGVTWATISGGGTPETVATLSGMNFSSTGVGELIKKVDASNAGGSGIVTGETSVGGVETHSTIFGTSTTQLGNITTKKDASNNYTITLEPNSGSGRNMVLTDDGISVELSLSATGSVSVGDFILESTPATSDPVKTFNRLKTTKEQILSTDAVSQGLADPNKNEPITCQALLDSTANAVIASTNASGLHLLPPSGSVLQSHLDNLTVPTLKTSAIPTLTTEIGYNNSIPIATGITLPKYNVSPFYASLGSHTLNPGVYIITGSFTTDGIATYGTTAILHDGTGNIAENFTVVVVGGYTSSYITDTVVVPVGTTKTIEFRANVNATTSPAVTTAAATKYNVVRIA